MKLLTHFTVILGKFLFIVKQFINYYLFLVLIAIIYASFSNAKCINACPDNHAPVCARASNGQIRIFSNRCELDYESCQVPSAGDVLFDIFK